MSPTPLERLRRRTELLGAPLCLGIDPHPDELPGALPADVRGIETFARSLIETASAHATAVKINVAFFEAFGSAGWAALERVRADVPGDLICILDAKRGDIGSTAERYAAGLFGHLEADGVTLSPYLGKDAIEPFIAYDDRLVYVLARTSNPSAATVQGLETPDGPVHVRVARWASTTWPGGRVGLVVGATAPEELARLREAVAGPGFLVPGVGAQGGDLEASVRACHGAWAPGVVSVSRALARAARGPDWASAAGAAAEALRERMRAAMVDSMDAVSGERREGA